MKITLNSIDSFLSKKIEKHQTGGKLYKQANTFQEATASDNFSIPKELLKSKVNQTASTLIQDYHNIKADSTPITSNQINKVKSFFNDYLNSPNYKIRLEKQGDVSSNKTIQSRKNNLNSATISREDKNNIYSTNYHPSTNNINLGAINNPTIFAHELSHSTGSINPNDAYYSQGNPNLTTLNRKEAESINKRNILKNKNLYEGSDLDKSILNHASSPEEVKADMDAFRFNLFEDKLHNTGKEEFTKDILDRAKPKYKSNFIMNRLFNTVEDKDLIWLMNNIANVNKANKSLV